MWHCSSKLQFLFEVVVFLLPLNVYTQVVEYLFKKIIYLNQIFFCLDYVPTLCDL